MSLTLVCPACLARWKITPSHETRDEPAVCPNCAPAAAASLDDPRRREATGGLIGTTPVVSAPSTSPVTFTITQA